MSLSNYAENLLLNYLFTNGAVTRPTSWYISLHTADPGETGGSEVTGGSYARVSATFNVSTAGLSDNTATVTFPTATASWGTVTHLGIYDALTSGNLLISGALGSNAAVGIGTTYTLAAGVIDCLLD